MTKPAIAIALLSAAMAPVAIADGTIKIPKTQYTMEHCMNAALAVRQGEVQALEMELNNGVPVYEFTLKAADDSKWEITCNAMTGKVIAQEQKVQEQEGSTTEQKEAVFTQAARITEDEARVIALQAHPGEVDEVERKMSAANVPVYEFEIEMADGTEREVEVDAVTGLIIGVEDEIYAIGDD
ncbi:MAG: peptidase [Betaproteobacteria bacterium]|nr:peptidase [Betaproteobacteria bacterium]